MKKETKRRKPTGFLDHAALALTTFGVGYLPLAPGTWGSMVGIAIYVSLAIGTGSLYRIADAGNPMPLSDLSNVNPSIVAWTHTCILVLFVIFILLGVWAAGRSTELFGDLDPSQAVVDEVIGQLIVFLFVPFGIGWPLILAGFLLFRIFDIWKPYPIDYLQNLPAGIGVCADDILAGVYAGVCLSFLYAVSLSI